MASYLKFELQDGTKVFVEVADGPKSSGGLIPSSRGENIAEQPALSFEKSFGAVQKMVSAMVHNLRDGFENDPDEVNISFGLKASADVNDLVIARSGVDTNFGISVRWRNNKKTDKEEKNETPEE